MGDDSGPSSSGAWHCCHSRFGHCSPARNRDFVSQAPFDIALIPRRGSPQAHQVQPRCEMISSCQCKSNRNGETLRPFLSYLACNNAAHRSMSRGAGTSHLWQIQAHYRRSTGPAMHWSSDMENKPTSTADGTGFLAVGKATAVGRLNRLHPCGPYLIDRDSSRGRANPVRRRCRRMTNGCLWKPNTTIQSS